MARTFFKNFGSELSDEAFACALAAIGISRVRLPRDNDLETVASVAQQLSRRLYSTLVSAEEDVTLDWTMGWGGWRAQAESWEAYPADLARAAAHAWLDAIEARFAQAHSRRASLRLGIDGRAWSRVELAESLITDGTEPFSPTKFPTVPWLVPMLSLADGVSAVHVMSRHRCGKIHWRWPVTVGHFSDDLSWSMREQFMCAGSPVRFVCLDPRNPDLANLAPVDLLILPHRRVAVRELLSAATLPSVHTVVLLGGGDGPGRSATVCESFRRLSSSSIVVDTHVGFEDWERWFGSITEQMQRGAFLDEALFRAQARIDGAVPFIVAQEGALDETSRTAVARRSILHAEGGSRIPKTFFHSLNPSRNPSLAFLETGEIEHPSAHPSTGGRYASVVSSHTNLRDDVPPSENPSGVISVVPIAKGA